VILGLTAIAGITLWEYRASVAEAILENWVKPALHPAAFPKIAAKLMADTGAEIVVLAEVAIRSNVIKNIDGLRRNQPGWEPALNPRPLYASMRDPARYAAFIEGRPVCHDIDSNAGEEERAEAVLGIKRRCYVAVPPVLDALVGILAIGWTSRPSDEAEAGAKGLLYTAATQLASW
jgi:hypothetical protein